MKLPSQKGIVREVTAPVTKTGSDGRSNRFQSLILTVPAYRDAFGEVKSQDQVFEYQLFNEQIDKENLLYKNLTGQKVTVEGFLNGRTFKANGAEAFGLNIKFKSVEIYQATS